MADTKEFKESREFIQFISNSQISYQGVECDMKWKNWQKELKTAPFLLANHVHIKNCYAKSMNCLNFSTKSGTWGKIVIFLTIYPILRLYKMHMYTTS